MYYILSLLLMSSTTLLRKGTNKKPILHIQTHQQILPDGSKRIGSLNYLPFIGNWLPYFYYKKLGPLALPAFFSGSAKFYVSSQIPHSFKWFALYNHYSHFEKEPAFFYYKCSTPYFLIQGFRPAKQPCCNYLFSN